MIIFTDKISYISRDLLEFYKKCNRCPEFQTHFGFLVL